ncbi:Asp-tRNA(Asn)/Glu-tRNA(Gln) amidotransferase GatCAB subunit B [Candidatus Pacearchaeota archaeon CG_4_10_14_0_2_um_filter_05_32_18]|nr:MAG: Asp-tRNA(Asn)/Glu-tRNA(Gln) amidotransferase GatCAB subunit B [Candidatus Pacearchaeota archaeon CG_4_10_14_0_2_um_filter_05_32_18]
MTLIGLEVHGYLDTKEKLFCNCSTWGEKPNTAICPICTAQPGSKPMLPNKEAIKKAVQIGLMLNTKINTDDKKTLIWQRKHYNWPDLPKGYQNTLSGTYAVPIGEKGKFLGIRIRELHLEEDPAAWNPETGEIDYNRSGLPLIEIVTEPDFTSSEQVAEWLKKLIITLSYIKAIKKLSGIKADVNVNIKGKSERAEIKNMHSISDIIKAIEYELKRHEKERPKLKETRRWDAEKNITESMRSKESQADYRFISDPDFPAIKISKKEVEKIKNNLPETPEEKLRKLVKKHKLNEKDAKILTKNLELVELVEELSKYIDVKKHISWITIELLRVLNYNKKTLDEIEIEAKHIGELIKEVASGGITELKAKQIMNEFVPKSFSIKDKKDISKTPGNEIKNICIRVIKENPKAVQDYKNGEEKSLNFLIGKVMSLSNRRADYKATRKELLNLMK